MQGGGAYISGGGSADFTGCNIFNNEAGNYVRARFLNLLDPSSSAPLNSDTLRCFLHSEHRWCLLLNLLDPSSIAPF